MRSEWPAIPRFQFTRARGARQSPRAGEGRREVSIHARTGRATSQFSSPPQVTSFQFTRARGARPLRLTTIVRPSRFQFTRARGARRGTSRPLPCRPSSFNSRAHGARDRQRVQAHRRQGVSIHARTGRATRRGPVHVGGRGVSIHARTGRATFRHSSADAMNLQFQFTRARGARPGRPARNAGCRVSIHARTGRATNTIFCRPQHARFQFTRARGARRNGSWRTSPGSSFNSRAHGARDPRSAPGSEAGAVSIHARTGRATSGHPCFGWDGEFQFTRARGARRPPRFHAFIPASFNSRAHGARDGAYFGVPVVAEFQFTRARGARPTAPPRPSQGA